MLKGFSLFTDSPHLFKKTIADRDINEKAGPFLALPFHV
jgi:hypothetical protein